MDFCPFFDNKNHGSKILSTLFYTSLSAFSGVLVIMFLMCKSFIIY